MILQGTKIVLVNAFQQAMTDQFWKTINGSTEQINPADIVLKEYPTDKIKFPFARVSVDFDVMQWDNISPNAYADNGQPAMITGVCTIDMYALSAEGRDAMADGFLSLLAWRTLAPQNVFDQYCENSAKQNNDLPLVKLQKGNIKIGTFDDAEDLMWDTGKHIYTMDLSVPFIATQTFTPTYFVNTVKGVTVTGNLGTA